jgi:hypothetical protein
MSDVKTPIDTTAYLEKLTKLIPGEIIALYLAIAAFVPKEIVAQSIVAGLAFVLTPLYLTNVAKVKNVMQVIVSTISFAVWVFVTGGPFTGQAWYQAWIPGAVLAAYTLIVPMFVSSAPAATGTAARTKGWREI